VTQSEDAAGYFTSQGWDAVEVDGHDIAAVAEAVARAKADDNGRPKAIIARTLIGKGIPEVAGTAKGHGEGGAKFIDPAKAGLGLPAGTSFHVSDETRAFFTARKAELQQQHAEWMAIFDAWAAANPGLAAELRGDLPADLSAEIPEFAPDHKDATRGAGGVVINALAKAVPQLLTGSADLFGSTKNLLKDGGDFSKTDPLGRNLWFGIREHAMGAICNGIAYDGIFRASGATFLVFADYLRGSIRLSALAGLPVTWIFTHDSVGVGEDGPTHQPVETVSSLRVIPNLDVIRPADAEETAGAWIAALTRPDGPTALVLTRQSVPLMNELPATNRREGAAKGGYIVRRETSELTTILLASGSEVQHAVAAAAELGDGVRVVSMPCFERFDRQDADYREAVLPAACTRRIAIEAGVSGLWWKYVGTAGKVLGIDRFGLSAPGDVVMRELGISKDSLLAAAR
jgi:transketolase